MNGLTKHGLVLCIALLAGAILWKTQSSPAAETSAPNWQAFDMSELLQKRAASNRSYLQFLKVPSMNCGVYVLGAGARDGQSPHRQDEVYYVVAGKGMFEVGSGDDAKSVPVKPGSILFVKAGAEHRFHDISEELQLLVFFSAADSNPSSP